MPHLQLHKEGSTGQYQLFSLHQEAKSRQIQIQMYLGHLFGKDSDLHTWAPKKKHFGGKCHTVLLRLLANVNYSTVSDNPIKQHYVESDDSLLEGT